MDADIAEKVHKPSRFLFVCAVIATVKTRMDQQRKRGFFCIYLQNIQRK